MLAVAFALTWIPARPRRWLLPALALLVAVAYPFFVAHLFTIPVFGAFPDVSTGIYMVVFIMMAVGLNIVVGYAGLLDLGYVAFYATGAYTAGWFASGAVRRAEVPEARLQHRELPGRARPEAELRFGGIGIPSAPAASTSRSASSS